MNPYLRVGEYFTSDRLGLVMIVRKHGAGTVDVVTKAGKYFRISGLGLEETTEQTKKEHD